MRNSYRDSVLYELSCHKLFKILLVYHIISTVFFYGLNLVIFLVAHLSSDETYKKLLTNNLLFLNMLRNKVFLKKDFYIFF